MSAQGGEAELAVDIRSLLEANDPEVMRLVQDVFRECVLGKLAAAGEARETQVDYGGRLDSNGQWIWDTMFVVDLLSHAARYGAEHSRGVSELLGFPGALERTNAGLRP